MVKAGASLDEIVEIASRVTPAARQHRWLALQFTAFVHFGMNTFTDREWGDGKESPDTFAPTAFDPRQWARAFRDAGMRAVVLTCKHHDGFCLWPTATTEHSVARSGWRDGEGDVVREVAEACREFGLEFGIYLSPWDRNREDLGKPGYDEVFRGQLRELLSGYGPLHDVWFDGAHAPRDDPETFDWVGHYALIRELQPDACISVMGPDVRWCGNEAGRTRASEWNVIPLPTEDERDASQSWSVAGAYFGVPVEEQDLGSRARLAGARRLVWWPAMTNTSIRPGWFWHPAEDGRVKSLDHLIDVWYRSVGGGTQFLLNVPPDTRGLVHENDVARLRELGAVLRATFGTAVSQGARIDERERSRELWFAEPRRADVAVLAEDVRNHGQRVEAFELEASDGEDWRPVVRGTTIGPQRILRFEPVTARAFRLRITAARAEPALSTFSLHLRPAILRAPEIRRDADGLVTIDSAPGTTVRYSIDGSDPATGAAYGGPFALPRGGTVRARAFAAAGLAPLDLGVEAAASARFGLARGGWSIHAVDSEQAPDEAAARAIDGDPATLWHSRWSPEAPDHPHRIAIDLGRIHELTGFTYLPRQDGSHNGTIVRYDLRVSEDGRSWRSLIEDREFANVANHPIQQVVRFAGAERGRYVELVSRAAVDGRPWASAAEIGVLVD
jgi:alpha-L-fucosidase